MGIIFFTAEVQRELKFQMTNGQISNNIQCSMINFRTRQSYDNRWGNLISLISPQNLNGTFQIVELEGQYRRQQEKIITMAMDKSLPSRWRFFLIV